MGMMRTGVGQTLGNKTRVLYAQKKNKTPRRRHRWEKMTNTMVKTMVVASAW